MDTSAPELTLRAVRDELDRIDDLIRTETNRGSLLNQVSETVHHRLHELRLALDRALFR